MRRLIIATSLVASAVAADFSTKPARDAQSSYQRELSTAAEAYSKALNAARTKYSKALENAAKAAAASGNLDEVARLGEESKRLNSGDDLRRIWIHPDGFYQRLHDGMWAARAPTGERQFFTEVQREPKFVDLTLRDIRIRLFDDHSEATSKGTPKPEWSYRGGWRQE